MLTIGRTPFRRSKSRPGLHRLLGGCTPGFSCATWTPFLGDADHAAADEINPRVVFERMFDHPTRRAARQRMQRNKSILDSIADVRAPCSGARRARPAGWPNIDYIRRSSAGSSGPGAEQYSVTTIDAPLGIPESSSTSR
jgi:hypothetical protein